MRRSRIGSSVPALLSVLVLLGAGCATVPITGRQQLDLVPPATLNAMAAQTYKAFLAKHRLSHDAEKVEMVQRVGRRIAAAVESYLNWYYGPNYLPGCRWRFALVEDKEVNAWSLPDGTVVVYTGLLPVARTDNGLAVVIAHEIAHVVAHHGSERMSQALLVDMAGQVLSEALANEPEATFNLFMQAFGLGSELGVLLPYSRLQEKEADRLGLIFMALAGYDPRGAVELWQRMMQVDRGGAAPAFLLTHPSDEERIDNIRRFIPEALRYYRPTPLR